MSIIISVATLLINPFSFAARTERHFSWFGFGTLVFDSEWFGIL
jgi:hypothetical protein